MKPIERAAKLKEEADDLLRQIGLEELSPGVNWYSIVLLAVAVISTIRLPFSKLFTSITRSVGSWTEGDSSFSQEIITIDMTIKNPLKNLRFNIKL